MSFEFVKEALLKKHVARHGRNDVGLRFTKDFINEKPYIEVIYPIKPPARFPYVNFVRLRAVFLDNYMMVQEVSGPKHLVESAFTQNFFNLIEFTPKKALKKDLQNKLQEKINGNL